MTLTDIPFIRCLAEAPHSLPMIGHLFALGDDHASVCERWWRRYDLPIFQVRLGNTRAVVVNSFVDARKLFVGHQSALIDRPRLYTFHSVISSTQGFTLGTSPWDETCKRKRKIVCGMLNRTAVQSYHPMFDLESYCLIRDLYLNSQAETAGLSPRPYIQRFALNTTLTLCYGLRMDHVYDDLMREILHVGSAISLLRSASENLQDYIPLLRYLPGNKKNRQASILRKRRDEYLNVLLEKARVKIANGTDNPCVSSAMLRDKETRLTSAEVSSVCLSLVSGGFETIPGTMVSCIASLSTPSGQTFQDRAYASITQHGSIGLPDIWQSSFIAEDIPYVNALVKESLRYYTVSAMSLPRKTISPIPWSECVTIPAGTMILLNAQAANHDIDHFGPDAGSFNPERWLDYDVVTDAWTEKASTGIQHFGFGAGSRACVGQNIAHRLLYTALVRLLSCFKVVASEKHPPETDYVEYNAVKSALVAIPRDFKVRLEPRGPGIKDVLREAERRTEGFYVE